jgi:HD-GYP domain-containing protein (c-di-GMP phosphodiesterase class II)
MFNNLKSQIAVAVAAATAICLAAFLTDLIFCISRWSLLLTVMTGIQALAFVSIALLLCKIIRQSGSSHSSKTDEIGVLPENFSDHNHIDAKFGSLISIIENIESNKPFKDILEFIYNSFSPYIPYSHIGVALICDDMTTIRAAYGVSGPAHPNLAKRLVGYKTDIHRTSLFQVLQSGKPRVINDLESYLYGRKIHEYNRILLDEGIKSSITFPLVKNGMPIGIIFFSGSQKNIYRDEHLYFLKILANSIMLSLEKVLLLDEMVVSSTLALATLAEERDNETGMHLVRMKRYTTLLAELLLRRGMFPEQIDTDYISALERFSPLHDIGKVAISDLILLKPGRLTPEEFNIMKTHATYGGKVLRLADENVKRHGHSIFGMGIDITEGHHEWWDGTGYPFGHKGDSIPLSARVVAVADVLDALTSKRPYKEPYSFEVSAAMIADGAGSHFDPRIIDVFNSNYSAFKSVYNEFSGTP